MEHWNISLQPQRNAGCTARVLFVTMQPAYECNGHRNYIAIVPDTCFTS